MGDGHRDAARCLWDDTLVRRFATALDSVDLPGHEVDVAIIGGGLTGLWTAYYLARADPSLEVVVIEARTVGFGASGRNGGWCSALLPVGLDVIARRHGRPAAIRLQREMHATVDEVIDVTRHESIECGIVKGGTIDLARAPAQVTRAREQLERARSFGFGDDHLRWLEPDEVAEVCRAADVAGALFTPDCAALQPAQLVHGLAERVKDRGVRIVEGAPVERIEPGRVFTDRGPVRARVVVRATEAYTAAMPGHRRTVVPLYSLMIATAPLPRAVWDEVGLDDRPTFTDHRHTVIYGQRTADDRLAFGGRGAPYHYASAIRPDFDTDERVRARLTSTLFELFPAAAGARITHHWGGPLGVPRDLQCSISYDNNTKIATAGGYVGDGVATTNLAGRALCDLIRGESSDLTRLPWVGHRSRRWEPEPLRWAGINAARVAAELADRSEARQRRGTSMGARFLRALGRR